MQLAFIFAAFVSTLPVVPILGLTDGLHTPEMIARALPIVAPPRVRGSRTVTALQVPHNSPILPLNLNQLYNFALPDGLHTPEMIARALPIGAPPRVRRSRTVAVSQALDNSPILPTNHHQIFNFPVMARENAVVRRLFPSEEPVSVERNLFRSEGSGTGHLDANGDELPGSVVTHDLLTDVLYDVNGNKVKVRQHASVQKATDTMEPVGR